MSTRIPMSWLTIILLGALGGMVVGCQTTITSTVKGSKKPHTQPCREGELNQISNGGFTIDQKCLFTENTVVGDGIEEATLWEFDFSGNEDYVDCLPEDALIELHLHPLGNVLGESLRVEGKWVLGLEQIQSLEQGVDQTTTIDMMVRNGRPSPYSPREINRLIALDPPGRLSMVYELNAIVSYARLEISCAN